MTLFIIIFITMQPCTVPYTLSALILGIHDQKIIIDENFTRLYDMTRIRTVCESKNMTNLITKTI